MVLSKQVTFSFWLVAVSTVASAFVFVPPATTTFSRSLQRVRVVSFSEANAAESILLADDANAEQSAPMMTNGESTEDAVRKVERERFTLFVGNLPFDVSNDKIKEIFEKYGIVELVTMPLKRESMQPRGFAFVDMSSPEELDAAIAGTHEMVFGDRILWVMKFMPKDQLEEKPRKIDDRVEPGMKKIYVGNIPFEATKEDMEQLYEPFGAVAEVFIPRNGQTGTGRGFAFVTMKEEDADQAIEATNGIEYGGRTLVVSLPLPPGEKAAKAGRTGDRKSGERRTKLYVGNLSFNTVPETIEEVFSEFGTVFDCYLPEDPETGGTRGFGFVTLSKDGAMRAVEELDGCEVDGRQIRVNEAQPKRK
jgi:RNA recognition motif-containing protein